MRGEAKYMVVYNFIKSHWYQLALALALALDFQCKQLVKCTCTQITVHFNWTCTPKVQGAQSSTSTKLGTYYPQLVSCIIRYSTEMSIRKWKNE